jgi:3',5'-cyclic AMP phosphodiesterase CpdA
MLLHISDPHFGTEQPEVVDALLRLADVHRPELVVLSGDVTQRARRSQFGAARRFVDQLNTPGTLVIPGNHDIPLFNLPARLLWPYAGFRRAFGRLTPEFDSSRLLVVTLNTTRASRHKNGVLSRSQIDQTVARLAQSRPGQLRVVVVHQPIAVERAQDEHDRLRGPVDEAIRRWAEAGADLVLGGHIHLPFVLPLHELAEGVKRRLWAVNAGTAVSKRVREGIPNSVNVIRWGGALPPGRCLVERWDYAAEQLAFVRGRVSSLDIGWRGSQGAPSELPAGAAAGPLHRSPLSPADVR